MNIYFDVDYTILSFDQALRRGTLDVFARLVAAGHQVHVWSGEGARWGVVRQHGLEPYVSGVFAKPLQEFASGLHRFRVSPPPEFVIDDYPEIVSYFGGYHIREFFHSRDDDDELQTVCEIVAELESQGHSSHPRWRPPSPEWLAVLAESAVAGESEEAAS